MTTTRRAVLRTVPVAATAGLLGCTGDSGAPEKRNPGSFGPNPTEPPSVSAGPLGRVPRGRPNVVVISIDDLGWRDLGCYGNTFNESPNIDRLAREGTAFDQAYAAAPVCSPSRAALVTGLYPGRVGITNYLSAAEAPSNLYLDPRFGGVGPVLASRGYQVGLVGKWHLSEVYEGPGSPGNPADLGFTQVRVTEEEYIADGDYFAPYEFMPDVEAPEGEYLTDRVGREAIDLITENRHRPFFVHVSNYSVHTKYDAPSEVVEHFEAKEGADNPANNPLLAAMLKSVDDQVGRIVATLQDLGLAERTLVLVTSDNGGVNRADNAPLRGGKGELHEGGIRVPLVAWSPGMVRVGHREDTLTSTIDILPTAAELAGATVPESVDGLSIVPLLTGRGTMTPRDTLYWAFPHFIGRTYPHAAIRQGKYKVVQQLRKGHLALFDLSTDPGEQHNLARKHPRVARRMGRELDAHLAELHLYPSAPGRSGTSVAALRFAGAAPDWQQLSLEGDSARFEVSEGAWRLASDEAATVLALSPQAPPTRAFAMVVDPVKFSGEGEQAVCLGLVKDEQNHLLVRFAHDTGAISWLATTDGVAHEWGREPLAQLDSAINLNRRGSKLALCMEGPVGSVWYDKGTGDGWEFMFRFNSGGVLDLDDPATRAAYRFAVGGRVDDSEMALKSFRVNSWQRRVNNR